MIFKTIDGEVAGISNRITMFGQSLANIKKYGLSAWGSADIDVINKYNEAIKNGATYTKAIDVAITGANGKIINYSKATGDLLKNANGAAISQKAVADASGEVNTKSKAASIGMQALNTALNMAIWAVAAKAISLLAEQIEHLANRQAELTESLKTLESDIDANVNEISSVEQELKNVQDRLLEINQLSMPTLADKSETEELERQNSELQRKIVLLKLQNEELNKQKQSQGEDLWNSLNSSEVGGTYTPNGKLESWQEKFRFLAENVGNALFPFKGSYDDWVLESNKTFMSAMDYVDTTIPKLESAEQKLNELNSTNRELTKNEIEQYQKLTEEIDIYKTNLSGIAESLSEIGTDEALREFDRIAYAIGDISDKSVLFSEEWNKIPSDLQTQLIGLAQQGELTQNSLSEIIGKEALDNLNSLTGSLGNTISEISGLAKESSGVEIDPIADAINQLETALSSLPPILAEVEEIQSKLNDGYSFSYEEIEELKEKYPQLESAIYRTAQGWSIEKDAVDQLYASTSNLSTEFANAQSVMTTALNNGVSVRLEQLGIELEGISSVADAYRQLGNATMKQQTDLGIPHQALTEDETKSVLGEDVYNVTIAAGKIAELQKKLKDLQSGGVSGGSPEKDQNKKQAKEQKEVNEALQEYLDLLNQRKNTGYYTGTDSDFKYLKDLEKALPLLKEFKYTDEEVKKQDTNSLNKSLYDANLAYQQQVLSVAKQRLQTDIDMQRIEENSQEHLDRLNHIYKELTAGGFELVNTEENRLALEKEILKVNQSLYKAKQNELEHAQAMEAYETTQEQHLANQKKYIEDLISLQSQYQFNQEDLRSLQEKIASEQKQYYQDVINYQQSKLDHDVAMGRVQENSIEYINRLIAITKQCHMDEETYWEYQEKIYQAQIEYERALIEARQKRYQQQQEDNDSVISAVTGVLDEEIKKLQEEKDALSDESIEGSYGAQIKAIQDRIDALQKVNEEHEKEIELEKAKAALEAAQNQKTLRVYREGEGFVYEADTDAIKEAQDNLDKLNQDKLIDDLEKEKEALEEQLKNQQDAYDKQIDALEKYKEQWSNIANVYEDQQNRILAAQKLGADWESKILSMRQDTLENFQNNYITIQERLADITAELEAFNERQTISDDYSSMYQEDIEQYEEYTQRYLDSRNQLNDITAEQQALANRKVMWVDEETSYYNHMIQITATNNALYESNMRLAESYREAANAMIDKANAEVEAKLIKKSGMKSTVQYAKGTSYVPKTDTYIVDEKGPELIVEPSVGESVTLKQGSAVIPADKTKKIIETAANDVGISSLQEKFKDIVRKLRDGSSVSRMTLMQNLNPLNADGISNITNNTSRNIVNNNTFKFGDLMFPNINAINQVQKFLDDLKRLPLDIEQWKHGIH